MTTITTRAGKGSPLTNTEVDNNFTNLNTAKYESGNNVSFGTGSFSGQVSLSDALKINNNDYGVYDGIGLVVDIAGTAKQTIAQFGTNTAGLFLTTDSPIISSGAYYNNGWINTKTTSTYLSFNSGSLELKSGSGTVGDATTWATSLTVDSNGAGLFSSYVRGTYFQDADDTSTYVDPNGQSAFTGPLSIRAKSGSEGTGDGTLYITAAGNNDWGLKIDCGGSLTGDGRNEYAMTIRMGDNAYNHAISVYDYYTVPSSQSLVFNVNSGGTEDSRSLRAPVFYDKENTFFFLDPTSNSRLTYIEGNNKYTFQGYGRYQNDWVLSTTGTKGDNGSSDNSWFIDNGSRGQWDAGALSNAKFRRVAGLTIEFEAYSEVYSGGSCHAMVGFVGGSSGSFNYNQDDSDLLYFNNAAYNNGATYVYTNGSSSGSSYSVNTVNGWWRCRIVVNNTGVSYWIYNDGWKKILRTAVNDNYNENWVRVLVTVHSGRIYLRNMRVYEQPNYGAGSADGGYLPPLVNGKFSVAGSVEASSYYDRDNTSYYVDPASWTNLSALKFDNDL
jgi:hypothetical protein